VGPGDSLVWIEATPGPGYFELDGLTQGFHLVTAVGEGENTPFQELRGSLRAYVKAGTTRFARLVLREAVPDKKS
jgi:hypothetical protein